MQNNRIILISSSTGGHAIPVFELYSKLKRQGLNPIVFHSGSKIEKNIFSEARKYKIVAGKLHRRFSLINIAEGVKIIIGSVQSFILLLYLHPKLVFSKGGFCAIPILSVAKLFRIPIFIHESDSVIGLANRLFMNKAKKVFLSFPLDIYSEKLPKNADYSGLIVREKIGAKRETGDGDSIKPVIFITGGSQGASYINKIIFEILPSLLSKYGIIHQVGINDYQMAIKVAEKLGGNENYRYFDFSLSKGEDALARADLIICRAGANTIGELSKLSKASILIPYRYAASDHQLKNARYLERLSAAILIREENLSGKTLSDRIEYLLSDKKNLETLGKNCNKAIKHDGLDYIADEIIKSMKD